MDYVEARKHFMDWLRCQMIGPAQSDEDTLVGIAPLDRYPTGVLHPAGPGISGIDPADAMLLDNTEEGFAYGEQDAPAFAEPPAKRRYVPPSAVGFSCFIKGRPRLHITVKGVRYQRIGARDVQGRFRRQEYRRIPLEETALVWAGDSWLDAPSSSLLGVDVRRRSFRDGAILTVTLFNRQQVPKAGHGYTQALNEKSLFEVHLACFVEAGELIEYPRVDRSLLTEEEQELELQYRKRHIYAIGHGAAVNWCLPKDDPPHIWTEFMPAVEVPQVTTELPGTVWPVLSMHRLTVQPQAVIVRELESFVAGYAQWVAQQEITDLAGDEDATARRIQARMITAIGRMQRGVALLAADDLVFMAFRWANQAMLNQMQQHDRMQDKAGECAQYRWRPFQLAFLLVVLESTVRPDDDFRDVLDLIWFPTGGGKTEAYLGLIAILILWRRMKHPKRGGGTVALMRYTLRLLTLQQFQRATRIICALELLRQADPDRLGLEPISVGLWVGKAGSPNTYREAREKQRAIHAGAEPPNGLVLAACPWCGAAFRAAHYQAADWEFHFVCTNADCEFGGDAAPPLPCHVVDEALYARPPSLLIGTIDKFARLAWEGRAGSFFGAGTAQLPPSLVLQDELHLITGPLGSVAGLYEAGLDTLLRMRGIRLKYIASTATIRMAAEQVRSLYGRKVAIFPPPGLSCDDSYFARTDTARPGRMYIGHLAPRLGKQQCLAPLAAALLAGPQEMFEHQADQAALLEAWWTQVIYHVSLKSVGESHTAYLTDVRNWTHRLHSEQASLRRPSPSEDNPPTSIPDRDPERHDRGTNIHIAQLTSIPSAKDNADTFARLEKPRGENGCLDVVLATNMVSVGLDVARLALMVVNSQPLTAAEYIQASSRVGRADVPGLVFINYHRHQARSLSHYENFRPFHESFYRFVEPTSVTPYTYQVRTRALHAALVIALRHTGEKFHHNEAAGKFEKRDPWTQKVIQAFVQRCAQAEPPDRAGTTAQHIERLVTQWDDEAAYCREQRRALKYDSGRDRGANALLCDPLHPAAGLWPTLHSMRNVENTAVLKAT